MLRSNPRRLKFDDFIKKQDHQAGPDKNTILKVQYLSAASFLRGREIISKVLRLMESN
jgi:hypothetical protein